MSRIEQIEIGDLVLSYDEATGKSDWKPVLRLFRNETLEWYHIFSAGEQIVCTAEHPFYVPGKGFIKAKELLLSDKLLLSNDKTVRIEKIETEALHHPETTYNFEVEEFHTYFVSEHAILVHNDCEPKSPKIVNDKYLKNNGIDAHKFKNSIVGRKAAISIYDIYVDTADDLLWLGTKGKGKTIWIETFTTLADLLGG